MRRRGISSISLKVIGFMRFILNKVQQFDYITCSNLIIIPGFANTRLETTYGDCNIANVTHEHRPKGNTSAHRA